MGKAEVGSTKYLGNKLKAKGLQRLRWYCQVCERQMRDENGFKMHTQSESHVRQMLLVGEDPKKYIHEYSNQFKKDFLQLLRTSHGEKSVLINHFYQDYIHNKEHIHMNGLQYATKWPSLTELAKYLGREGICRVEETDKGLQIAWIDDSPEALRRRDAVRRKEMQDKGDEEREQRMIREQIKRARREAGGAASKEADDDAEEEAPEARELKREEGEKIKLSFGAAKTPAPPALPSKESSSTERPPPPDPNSSSKPPEDDEATDAAEADADSSSATAPPVAPAPAAAENPAPAPASGSGSGPVSLKMGAVKPQTKNVFAAAKKNALAGAPKKKSAFEQPKKMSEAERIMKEEMEKKRSRGSSGFSGANKRQKM